MLVTRAKVREEPSNKIGKTRIIMAHEIQDTCLSMFYSLFSQGVTFYI